MFGSKNLSDFVLDQNAKNLKGGRHSVQVVPLATDPEQLFALKRLDYLKDALKEYVLYKLLAYFDVPIPRDVYFVKDESAHQYYLATSYLKNFYPVKGSLGGSNVAQKFRDSFMVFLWLNDGAMFGEAGGNVLRAPGDSAIVKIDPDVGISYEHQMLQTIKKVLFSNILPMKQVIAWSHDPWPKFRGASLEAAIELVRKIIVLCEHSERYSMLNGVELRCHENVNCLHDLFAKKDFFLKILPLLNLAKAIQDNSDHDETLIKSFQEQFRSLEVQFNNEAVFQAYPKSNWSQWLKTINDEKKENPKTVSVPVLQSNPVPA